MLGIVCVLAVVAGILVGCETTGTRDRPFTDDWATHNRRHPSQQRRSSSEEADKSVERIGPATVERDESGRPRLNVGGDSGIGADVGYRRGPSGRVRYRREWDFVRPERGR